MPLNKSVWMVFVGALLVRGTILMMYTDNVGWASSSMMFVDVARHVVEGKGLGYDDVVKREFQATLAARHDNKWIDIDDFLKLRSSAPEAYQPYRGRSPGYILFLSLVFFLTGSMKVFFPRLIQIILNASLCFALYSMGKQLWSHRVGLWAAILFACWVPQALVSVMVGHDGLIPFFVGLSLFAFTKTLADFSWSRVAWCAVLVGLGINVRESCLLLAGLFVVGWLVLFPLRASMGKLLLFVALIAGSLLPWSLWNKSHVGRFMFLIPHQGVSLLDGIADADAFNQFGLRELDGTYHWDRLVQQKYGAEAPTIRSVEYNDALMTEARRIIRQNPAWYAKSVLKRVVQFTVLPWSMWQLLASEPQWSTFKAAGGTLTRYIKDYPAPFFFRIFGKAVEGGLFILFVAGLALERKRWREMMVFAAVPLITIFSLAPMKIQPSYIVPMQIPYFLLAAALLARWWRPGDPAPGNPVPGASA